MSEKKFNRKKTRTFLFQKLYASAFSKVEDKSFFDAFFEWTFDFELDKEYLSEMFEIITENEYALVYVFSKLAPKFDIKNMNLIYILPFFIAASEMLYLKEEIPAKVSINESVELAKNYWDESSKKIVNWVLSKLFANYESLKEEVSKIDKDPNYKSIFFA